MKWNSPRPTFGDWDIIKSFAFLPTQVRSFKVWLAFYYRVRIFIGGAYNDGWYDFSFGDLTKADAAQRILLAKQPWQLGSFGDITPQQQADLVALGAVVPGSEAPATLPSKHAHLAIVKNEKEKD